MPSRLPSLSSHARASGPARWAAGAVAAGALLALLGPFGSYLNGSLAERSAYWISAMLLGLLLYGGGYRALAIVGPSGRSAQAWALVALALLASVPEALVTRAVAFRLWPLLAHLHVPLLQWYLQTALLGLMMIATCAWLDRRPPKGLAPQPAPAPTGFGPDVLALQMEDHYVRVHRATGSELVLMPLARAIAGMATDGLRTHRSWWVARHAVAAVEGTPRAMRLRLSNGIVAPVARSAVAHLKAAGWTA